MYSFAWKKIYFDIPFEAHSKENVFGVCFKIKYSMTNQSLCLTFKHNIFRIKISANATLRNGLREQSVLGTRKKNQFKSMLIFLKKRKRVSLKKETFFNVGLQK